MKVIKHQIQNENVLFFIKDYQIDTEIMNIEVLMKRSKNEFTEEEFLFANVENDVAVARDDMNHHQVIDIIKNINIYKRDNLVL